MAVRTERSEFCTKMTDGQYSPVRLEQARLVSSLLYGTSALNLTASKTKNTSLMTVSMETVRVAKSRPRKNQSERQIYPATTLPCNKMYYYSFKIFPRFGLVETTRIIHHNQLLFTKFGKNLRHIQSMTSKVEPAAYYSTVDVKMTSKVKPAADYSTVDQKNLGTRL